MANATGPLVLLLALRFCQFLNFTSASRIIVHSGISHYNAELVNALPITDYDVCGIVPL